MLGELGLDMPIEDIEANTRKEIGNEQYDRHLAKVRAYIKPDNDGGVLSTLKFLDLGDRIVGAEWYNKQLDKSNCN